MKKVLSLFLVALTLFSLCLSLSSCSKVEDIPGSKATQVNLKFNFYETVTLEKNDFSKQWVMVKADSPLSSLKELDGKTVAVQKASTAKSFCDEAGYTVVEFATTDEAKLAVLEGRADAAVIDGNNALRLQGETVKVLCDGFDAVAEVYYGRSFADAPDVDGRVYFTSKRKINPGAFVEVKVTEALDYDLVGEVIV